jgi:(E)-4-hydroxy-3-methylbut-2-enyl-diphosphate synthase
MRYCQSPFLHSRRQTREVVVGDPANGGVIIGGHHPVVKQSMITCDTMDTAECVQQTLDLAAVGCQIVRITAPTVKDAANLKNIVAELRARACRVPIVADIHFKPDAAMEAARWVEMVRVNPGNYADKKKFAVREYSDDQYTAELARLEEQFTPLVKLCRELGRAMRIGTNHGSLSDRIMNRYGDTPLGMVESALEFARIARGLDYHNFKFSMKSSNPKVMIECYRLLVARLEELGPDWNYPIHLGVTEAGEGEDGRIKSAIGIGSLLCDGLGDTIRVSLTEDSPREIAVCTDLLAQIPSLTIPVGAESSAEMVPSPVVGRAVPCPPGEDRPMAVPLPLPGGQGSARPTLPLLSKAGVFPSALASAILDTPAPADPFAFTRRPSQEIDLTESVRCGGEQTVRVVVIRAVWDKVAPRIRPKDDVRPEAIYEDLNLYEIDPTADFTINCDTQLVTVKDDVGLPAIAAFRLLASKLKRLGRNNPILLKDCLQFEPAPLEPSIALLRASVVIGSLLADGIGDAILIRGEPGAGQSLRLAYNILQAAGCRSFKTDYVACPSCGRTLFNLQTVTARIKERTQHLKGVKIAIMGCIVNGPGEMADADFGYVGGAPNKINLYVGKTPVKFNIPEAEAVDRLVDLIREHNKWVEPERTASPVPVLQNS